MKNYNEIADNVLKRRDEYETKKKNQRKFITKTLTTFCCIGLISLVAISVWQNGLFKNDPANIKNDSIYIGEVDHYGPNESPTKNKIVINNLDSSFNNRVKHDFEIKAEDFIKMDKTEINEYYGVNIFPALPNDIKEREDTTYGIYKKDLDGEVYYDQNILNYSNLDFTRNINIEIKKDSIAVLDYGVDKSSEEKSIINNWQVLISHSNPNSYQALFLYKNVGFCVNADGLSQEEFITILSSIIK